MDALKQGKRPILIGVVAGVVVIGIGFFGYFVVDWTFPSEVPATDAIEILKAIISIDGVLLGFLGVILLLFFSSNNAALDRIKDIHALSVSKRSEELASDRRTITILAIVSFGLLILSVLTSIVDMAGIPTGNLTSPHSSFVWPIGFLMAGLIMLIPFLAAIGLGSTG